MSASLHSLLSYLDAPVVVGDPQGRAVYANPAFEACFGGPRGALGRPLAELFEGGAREGVLRAVARVCEVGESVRLRLRERGHGFAAVVSPIVAEDSRVGVVILLQEEVEAAERLMGLHREIQDPLADLAAALDALLEQTGGRRAPRYRGLLEDGLRALSRLRKWSEELGGVLGVAPGVAAERFDPAQVVRRVRERVGAGTEQRLRLLAPSTLPAVAGDPDRLERVLSRMLEGRLGRTPAPVRVVLGARALAGDAGVLIALTEHFTGRAPAAPPADAPEVAQSVEALGARVERVVEPRLGRTTLLHLPRAG